MPAFVDRDKLALLMQSFDELHKEAAELLKRHGHSPAAGSPAAEELASYSDPDLLLTAYAQADLLTEAASEHVSSFRRAAIAPALTLAPWACVRAVIESSALASWLLDAAIDAHERVKRSFAFRYEGLDQQVKLARATGNQPALQGALNRMDLVERKALSLGFGRVLNKNQRRIGFAQVMPGITSLVGEVLGEANTYRLLSAVTHAHTWALQQIGYLTLERANDSDSQARALFLKKTAKPICFRYLSLKTVEAFSRTVIAKATLFGWDGAYVGTRMQFYCAAIDKLARDLEVVLSEVDITAPS